MKENENNEKVIKLGVLVMKQIFCQQEDFYDTIDHDINLNQLSLYLLT